MQGPRSERQSPRGENPRRLPPQVLLKRKAIKRIKLDPSPYSVADGAIDFLMVIKKSIQLGFFWVYRGYGLSLWIVLYSNTTF